MPSDVPNIIFLDVDGPLIPLRLHKQHSDSGLMGYDYHYTGTKVMDKDFIQYLNDVLPMYNYKIVFNSAHNDFGYTYLYFHAFDNKFDLTLLHSDLHTLYPSRIYSRMDAITDWLMRNPANKWIVVDDVYIADGINHVRPSLQHGMTPDMIDQLSNLLMNNN